MRWFYELTWLWKGLGISLLAAAACMACVWLVCRAAGKRLRTGIAVLAAAAGFAAAVVVIAISQPIRFDCHSRISGRRMD